MSHGICAVSYLSKIEQGKADANPQLLADLFARLQINWADSAELDKLRDELYESIFSWNDKEIIPLRKKTRRKLGFAAYKSQLCRLSRDPGLPEPYAGIGAP